MNDSLIAEESTLSDAQLEAAGFAKRYYLCGHPAYPDPLNIWPPTEENAERIYREYCTKTWDEYVARLGHTPFGWTAEKFNPRVLIVWEHVAQKRVFKPADCHG